MDFVEAGIALQELAAAFLGKKGSSPSTAPQARTAGESLMPSLEDRYRVLVEQIPAVVFMAFFDGDLSEAYVSPQIEQMLGFTQAEWLDDPIRWYQQIHPEDKQRWSLEAAQLISTGNSLKSSYRVLARDGRVVWFHCEAKLVRKQDGQPWFLHGVGFDITELKETEQALHAEMAERERLEKQNLERERSQAEEAHLRLAAIVESSQDAILARDPSGTITSWNAAASRLFGYSAEEMIGASVFRLIPPELHLSEFEILRKLQAGERIEHYETQRITKAGTRVDVSLTISPIRNALGQVIGASKIARDITQQKRAQQALRASEERFRSLSTCSPMGIFLTDTRGHCTYTNARCQSICGFTFAEALGEGWFRFLHREDRERVRRTWTETGLGGREYADELRWGAENGAIRWTSVRTAPLFSDAGETIGHVGTVEDITARKAAEEALRESEERFRSMAETAADAIFRIDEQSTLLFANRAAEKVFGYAVSELVGQNLAMLMPEPLRAVHRAAVERYLRTGKRHVDWERLEVKGRHKDGREIALELSLGESIKDGNRLFTGFVRDITDRKRIEEKLRITEKLAATGRLAATISHEINNPLEGATNFVYLAMTDPDPAMPARVRQYLQNADRELRRVAHIARQTLGFYRDTTAPVNINIPELLTDILQLYRGKMEYKRLRLRTEFDESCEIHALQGEIRQVFSNILANAIEASPQQGALVVRVTGGRSQRTETPGVRVSIGDKGPGIPDSAGSRIFEPFYSTKKDVGTGLGLWVSKSLVEKHGGSIRFWSSNRPGRSGTVFSVFLPRHAARSALPKTA